MRKTDERNEFLATTKQVAKMWLDAFARCRQERGKSVKTALCNWEIYLERFVAKLPCKLAPYWKVMEIRHCELLQMCTRHIVFMWTKLILKNNCICCLSVVKSWKKVVIYELGRMVLNTMEFSLVWATLKKLLTTVVDEWNATTGYRTSSM